MLPQKGHMTELVEAARAYLAMGMHILALNGKRPDSRYHQHWSWEDSIWGEPDNLEQEAELAAIFNDPGVTGIALLVPQHMLVADIDSEGAAKLYMHLAGSAPDTVVAMSHHGLHAWFIAPGAEANRWLDGQTLLFKGFGGYVVAPPSRFAPCEEDPCLKWHSPYIRYAWLNPLGEGVDGLPEGIAERLALLASSPAMEKAKAFESDGFKMAHIELTPGGFRAYQVHNIDGLVKLIRNTPEGNRNNMLAWASMQAAETGVPLATVQPKFTEAALAAGLNPREIAVTIRAAYHRTAAGTRG